MDVGYVGTTGAAPFLRKNDGGIFRLPTSNEVTYTAKEAAPSTCGIDGGRGFSQNGPTPTPSEVAAFAEAALAASFRSIPASDKYLVGDGGRSDRPQRLQRHSMGAFPPASTNWSDSLGRSRVLDDSHNHGRPQKELWRSADHVLGDNREERPNQAVGIDGGSASARAHADGMSSRWSAGTYALEQELVGFSPSPKRMRSSFTLSLPGTTRGMALPPSRRDHTHLMHDSSRTTDEAMKSISANPAALAGVPMDGTTVDPTTTAVRRHRRSSNPQERQKSFVRVNTQEQHCYLDMQDQFGRDREPPRRRARAAVVGAAIPKSGRKRVGNPCQHPTCSRGSTFGAKGGAKKPIYCATHKHDGMVKITSRQCADELCSTAPSYGFQGKRACFCSKHKMPGMVNVVTPRCQRDGCGSCASYGHTAERRPLFCSRHAQAGMLNVVSRKCLGIGCTKNPSYGNPGDRRASFCGDHRLDGMLNIVSPKCLAPECRKAPSFGQRGDRKASWCKTHKQEGMVNVLTLAAVEKKTRLDVGGA
eukprot:g10428.t1